MAENASKIEYFGKVLLDLTSDTVTPETLDEGITAHDKTGAPIVGTRAAGGGASVETCTVTVNIQRAYIGMLCATCYENGEFVVYYDGFFYKNNKSATVTIENVVCGSTVSFTITASYVMPAYSLTDGVEYVAGQLTTWGYVFKAPITAGAHGTITIYDDD